MSDSKCRVPASGSCAGFANQFHCSAASIASEHMWISRCQEKVNASRWGTDTISKGSQKQCVFQKDGNIEIQYLEEAPLEMLHDILWPCNLFLKVEKEKLYMAIKVQEPSGTAPKQVRNSPVSLCCSPSSTPSFFFFKKKKKSTPSFFPSLSFSSLSCHFILFSFRPLLLREVIYCQTVHHGLPGSPRWREPFQTFQTSTLSDYP